MTEPERRLRAALDWLLAQDAPEVHHTLAQAEDELEYEAERECLSVATRGRTGYIDLTVTSAGILAVTRTEGSARIIHSMPLPSAFLSEHQLRGYKG